MFFLFVLAVPKASEILLVGDIAVPNGFFFLLEK